MNIFACWVGNVVVYMRLILPHNSIVLSTAWHGKNVHKFLSSSIDTSDKLWGGGKLLRLIDRKNGNHQQGQPDGKLSGIYK